MPEALTKTEQNWVRAALQANVPGDRIETVIVLSRLHKVKPDEIQNHFMDAYIGRQQVFRNFGQQIEEQAKDAAAAEGSN